MASCRAMGCARTAVWTLDVQGFIFPVCQEHLVAPSPDGSVTLEIAWHGGSVKSSRFTARRWAEDDEDSYAVQCVLES